MDAAVQALSPQERREALDLLELKLRLQKENSLPLYRPYPKQAEFHAAGGLPQVRERLLMAGNQLGKTWSAAYETAMHLSGRYPSDWPGLRLTQPAVGWAASLTSQGTRDSVQRLLLGQPGDWGTGAIPKECLVEVRRATHGVSNAVETILVRHQSGGLSRLTFKTYDQGRERWQGETLDFVWFDEEPPQDIYFEGLTRTNATQGRVYMTFTPLLGMSAVVKRFLVDPAPGTHVTTMTIADAQHYSAAQRAAIIAAYPEHERKARAHGIPMMGSGMVFPLAEEAISVAPFALPAYWRRIYGIDFGWDHPFAAAWLAIDPDSDTVYLTDCYRQRESTPAIHAAAMRARGPWIPVAWPHDGLQHDKGSGEQLAEQYKRQGLNLLRERATFENGSNSVEAGLLDLLERMQTGRFKVFAHLKDFFEEFRLYHRQDGKLVKENDDLISATRYALMMKRHAKPLSADARRAEQVAVYGVLDEVVGY